MFYFKSYLFQLILLGHMFSFMIFTGILVSPNYAFISKLFLNIYIPC